MSTALIICVTGLAALIVQTHPTPESPSRVENVLSVAIAGALTMHRFFEAFTGTALPVEKRIHQACKASDNNTLRVRAWLAYCPASSIACAIVLSPASGSRCRIFTLDSRARRPQHGQLKYNAHSVLRVTEKAGRAVSLSVRRT